MVMARFPGATRKYQRQLT